MTDAERAPRVDPVGPTAGIDDPRFGVFVRGRVHAVLGERLFVPIEFAGGYSPADLGPVLLDDGRTLPAELYWVEVTRLVSLPGQWLPPAETWRPFRVGRPVPEGIGRQGFWAIVADPPIDAIGQGMWIAGRRVPLNWLPDPVEVGRRVPAEAWASPFPEVVSGDAARTQRLRPALLTPDRRWRARLFSAGLATERQPRRVAIDGRVERLGGGSRLQRFDDPVVESIASLFESQWLVGLARLYEADPALNRQVRRRLTGHVDFGGGELAPAWSIQPAADATLLGDLLEQSIPARERIRRVQLWLDRQPDGVAWIQSDAGGGSQGGLPITTVGVANLSWSSRVVSVSSVAQAESPSLVPIGSLRAISIRTPADARPDGPPRVRAELAQQAWSLMVPAADVPARPPAFRINGLLPDLTMRSWLEPAIQRQSVPGAAVQLYRDHLGRWVLYAVLDGVGGSEETPDVLRLSLGTAGSQADLSLHLTPEGLVDPESVLHGRPWLTDGWSLADIETGRFRGGWFVRLPIPAGCLDNSGATLRLGLERRRPDGARTAWPNQMLPWQQTVGRASIDLSAWDQ